MRKYFYGLFAAALLVISFNAAHGAGIQGTLKWSYTTEGAITPSPAIAADGTIYVGSDDTKLYALNPNGTLKWSYTTLSVFFSSPTIAADGTIYVGSWDSKIYALNPNGTLKWSYTTGDRIFSSPAIAADGTIYVASWDSKIYALNPNGTLKWSYTTGYGIDSSPAIAADGTIYVGGWDTKLYALNPNGTLKWSYTVGSYIYSSPAIGADGTVYVGSVDTKLYAINPNGTLKWSYATGGVLWHSSPAIAADGTIYVGTDDTKLYAINPNGTLKWSYATGDGIDSSPAIGADGTIYVGSVDTKLYAINPNGTLKWSYATGDEVLSSPAIGADGTIYVGSQDGKLYAINSSSLGLAPSSWPMFGHDLKHTGYVLSPFFDVPLEYWAYTHIMAIYNAGYTTGYGVGTFAPELNVTREQMAAFIIRAADGEPATDYCSTGSPFPDCSTDSWSCRYIKRLFDLGLTTGYGTSGLFMPALNVTREQMAAFIVRAVRGEPAANYCSSGSPFTDVLTTDWSCIYIKRLYELGITTGYGDGRYGPYDLVTRAQMAVFLGRAFLGMQ